MTKGAINILILAIAIFALLLSIKALKREVTPIPKGKELMYEVKNIAILANTLNDKIYEIYSKKCSWEIEGYRYFDDGKKRNLFLTGYTIQGLYCDSINNNSNMSIYAELEKIKFVYHKKSKQISIHCPDETKCLTFIKNNSYEDVKISYRREILIPIKVFVNKEQITTINRLINKHNEAINKIIEAYNSQEKNFSTLEDIMQYYNFEAQQPYGF